MLALEHITLVDHDVVTVDNIYRQDYVRTDIGKKKVDVLKSRAVVPEFLRTLVFARPRGDDQFADCTFSPSLDMSR